MFVLLASATLTFSTIDKEATLLSASNNPVSYELTQHDVVKPVVKHKAKKRKSAIYAKVTYYGGSFHGKKTSSGRVFNKNALTAANLYLRYPFGTKLRITNVRNGKSVIVEIIDNGTRHNKYGLDLSEAAFARIGSKKKGFISARIDRI